MKKRRIFFVSAIFVFVLSGESAIATEEPAFTSSHKAGVFEVRSYPTLVAAQVSVTGTRDEASNAGFKLLAGYIFGGNTRRQSIAMTAPVLSKPAGETIAMTAPVVQTPMLGGPEAWTVRFIMPAAFTMDTLPTPNDARVQLLVLSPARYAVTMFSGLAYEGDVMQRTAELNTFMTEHALRPIGPAVLARYDPPWTPWFLRRNEVHIPIAP